MTPRRAVVICLLVAAATAYYFQAVSEHSYRAAADQRCREQVAFSPTYGKALKESLKLAAIHRAALVSDPTASASVRRKARTSGANYEQLSRDLSAAPGPLSCKR